MKLLIISTLDKLYLLFEIWTDRYLFTFGEHPFCSLQNRRYSGWALDETHLSVLAI